MGHELDPRIALLVDLERQHQVKEFGDQTDHPDWKWFLILAEEFGELAKAMLEETPDAVAELVQVTAVGWAWLEAYFARQETRGRSSEEEA